MKTDNTDCNSLTTPQHARAFFETLNKKYSDMTAFPMGLGTIFQTVCIPQLTSCQMPLNTSYVCHREFSDLIANFNKLYPSSKITPTADPVFVTEAEYLRVAGSMVGKNSNFSFIKGFCMAIP